jgi:hypothetical protein
MSNDLENRLDDLEKRVTRLEYREDKIISIFRQEFVPLELFILQSDLNAEQVQGICDVMEYTHKMLAGGKPIDTKDFEKRLLSYIPEKEKPGGIAYPFIQCMLGTFTRTGQWSDVCKHFKRDYSIR